LSWADHVLSEIERCSGETGRGAALQILKCPSMITPVHVI
jgi:hypothetical protein